MEPSSPDSGRYTFLGFLGILFLFWLMFHFVFEGTLRTEHLPGFFDPRDPIFYGALVILYGLIQAIGRWLWKRYPQLKEHEEALIVSHKTVGLMTGVSYFFLAVIGLFIVIPLIALLYFNATGQL